MVWPLFRVGLLIIAWGPFAARRASFARRAASFAFRVRRMELFVGELLTEDALKHRPNDRTGHMGLAESTDPTVDQIHVTVNFLHGLSHFRIGVDVAEIARGAQTQSLTGISKAARSMIPAALHVE